MTGEKIGLHVDLWNWYGIEIDQSEIHFADSWCGYRDGQMLVVIEHDGKFFINSDFEEWKPYEVTQEEALQEMIDFEQLLLVDSNLW